MMKKRSNQSRFFFLLKLFYCSAIAGSCFLDCHDCRFVNTTIHHFVRSFIFPFPHGRQLRSGTDLPGDDDQRYTTQSVVVLFGGHNSGCCSSTVHDIDVGIIIYFLVCLLANWISSLQVCVYRYVCLHNATLYSYCDYSEKERHGPTKQALKICSKIERNSRLNS